MQRLLIEPATEQVLPRHGRLLGLPQIPRVIRGRPREQRVETLPALAPRRRRRVLGLGLELDAESVRQRLEGTGEVEPLGFHHEVEGVARRLATEAVVELLVGVDPEGRRALVVERAQPELFGRAGPPELRPPGDQRNHVHRLPHTVPRVGRVPRHGANATGMLSVSNALMQKWSVMPAR